MTEKKPPLLALILPCYKEREVLPISHPRLQNLLSEMKSRGEIDDRSFIFYIDDGSPDDTWDVISQLVASSPHTSALRLASNAGQQSALLAGFEAVADIADAAVTIDVDLQDDINVIPEMVMKYRRGADVVLGVRQDRSSDTWMKRNCAKLFYKTMQSMGIRSVYNHSEFRLLSRRCIHELLQYEERNLYLRGIILQLGHRQECVYYDRLPRPKGETFYSFGKLVNLSVDAITSFSNKPVRYVFWLGVAFIVIAIGMFVYALVSYFRHISIPGWPSLMISIWFGFGCVLISLGMIGEYISKIYMEVKHRPRFHVDNMIGSIVDLDPVSQKC